MFGIEPFYDEFPNSNVPHIEEYGYSEFDVKRYYKRAAAREVYITGKEKEFDLEQIDNYLAEKLSIDCCKHPLLWIAILLTILWNILLLCVEICTNMGFLVSLLIHTFGSISVLGALFIIGLILSAITSLVYNHIIHIRYEKENLVYYKKDELTLVLNKIKREQDQYLQRALLAPLPRIKYATNVPSRVPMGNNDLEIAKQIIAKRNTAIYRFGIGGFDLTSRLNNLLHADEYFVEALNVLDIPIKLWQKVSLDLLNIGIIRRYSRETSDYRWKSSKDSRVMYIEWEYTKEHINKALDYFDIPAEKWIELGEDVLYSYKIYERDYLKQYAFLEERGDKYYADYSDLL